MLEIRPNCENCGTDLKPSSVNAFICSFECTFCKTCALDILHNVCPNCGGGFERRPIRPSLNLKNGNYLGVHPASEKPVIKAVDTSAHETFASEIRKISPNMR
ncbi:DUF1272 domain-containing protein [Alteromonas oceanisediminis]|uniref:DUF1272 domain-containing protein n=1 Tax=Alteromonas oceanisediminis TaxID=2836180 RepID=UPI001BDAE47E|nr:DUF1272 domain-containing protein [Alteromonas oceanisediminis]MBT0587068.1 DUF1272 domain-containing protein [Alteromonas oceanisediminis]